MNLSHKIELWVPIEWGADFAKPKAGPFLTVDEAKYQAQRLAKAKGLIIVAIDSSRRVLVGVAKIDGEWLWPINCQHCSGGYWAFACQGCRGAGWRVP